MTITFEDRRAEESCEVRVDESVSTGRMTFTHEVTDRLLELLSSDDLFRALFQQDPRAALRQVGHETPEIDRDIKGADPVMCLLGCAELASKETIRATLALLHRQLAQAPFHFAVAGLQA